MAHKEEEESEEEFSSRVQKQIASELGVFATNHSSADKVEYAKRRLLERTLQQNTSGRRHTFMFKSRSNVRREQRWLWSVSQPEFMFTRIKGKECNFTSLEISLLITCHGLLTGNNNRPSGLSSSPLLTSGQDAASRMSLQVKEVLPHVPLSAITRDLGEFEPPSYLVSWRRRVNERFGSRAFQARALSPQVSVHLQTATPQDCAEEHMGVDEWSLPHRVEGGDL